MNTQNQNGYMLLFRGNDWTKSLSPEEKQKVTDQWMAWFRRLTDQGKAIAGNPLEPEGKIVSGKNRVVSDGPFAESKEAIGGYFLLDVASFDDAVKSNSICCHNPFLFRLFGVHVRLDDSEDVAGRICRVSEPANLWDCHLRHADFSAALLDLPHRLVKRLDCDGV